MARGMNAAMAKAVNVKAKNPLKTFSRLFGYYKDCRGYLITAIVFIFLYSASIIVASFLLKPLVAVLEDQSFITLDEKWASYIALIIATAGLYVLATVTNYIMNRLMLECSVRVLCAIRKDMFNKMQNLPVSFFDKHTHGELMSYYTNDTDAVRELLHHSITQLIISVVSLVGIIAFMLILSPPLFLIVVVLGVIVFFTAKYIGKKSGKNFARQQQVFSKVNGYIEEMMAGQKVVKAFNHEKQAEERFDELNEELCEVSTKANIYANVVGPIMNNLSHIFYAITTTVGAVASVETAVLVAFLQYIRQFSDRVSQISQQFNFILLALAGAERIFALIDETPEVDQGDVTLVKTIKTNDGKVEESDKGDWTWKEPLPDGGFRYEPLRGDVRFFDVDFSYEPEKPVLKDVSLYAKEGQKIAFVGSTGAGKTTITNLINRFYDINGGKITYDGIDIKRIKKADLRHSLGMVLQDTHLFTGTVMDNIRYGRIDATDEECIAAAKTANADYFILHLPDGYKTMLVSDGANLSQGQRQLISIARAAVSDPPVLILDEATSSIDTRTEKLIEKGMDSLMKGRTVLVIAHRLSTVRNANAIMVLENGKIIERGDHESLIAEKGKYYSLYTGKTELS